jgi:hypothetical protein
MYRVPGLLTLFAYHYYNTRTHLTHLTLPSIFCIITEWRLVVRKEDSERKEHFQKLIAGLASFSTELRKTSGGPRSGGPSTAERGLCAHPVGVPSLRL